MELKATKRSAVGKGLKRLREKGGMPAVVYGPKQEALAIEVSLKDFQKTLEKAGESTVINLDVSGEPLTVLIHEVDRDPVTEIPRHAEVIPESERN